jgi:hypothetical protein
MNPRGPRSGTGELRPVAARRKAAASGARTHGGRTVHAELSARGGALEDLSKLSVAEQCSFRHARDSFPRPCVPSGAETTTRPEHRHATPRLEYQTCQQSRRLAEYIPSRQSVCSQLSLLGLSEPRQVLADEDQRWITRNLENFSCRVGVHDISRLQPGVTRFKLCHHSPYPMQKKLCGYLGIMHLLETFDCPLVFSAIYPAAIRLIVWGCPG